MAAASSSSPTSPSADALNIRGTPAVVEWVNVNSQPQSTCYLAQSGDSSPIYLSLFFDSASNTAFFKLRAPVILEGTPPQEEIKTTIYIFIHPEQILSLVQEQPNKLPDGAAGHTATKWSGCKTACLRFALSKPASVVAPINAPVRPSSTTDSQFLDSVKLLAQQTAFAVYVAHDALPNLKLLQLLCRASSNGFLKSHPRHADLSSLYGGDGGRVVECFAHTEPASFGGKGKSEESGIAADALVEEPPSYNEIGPSPPSSASVAQSSHKKRKRASSGTTEAPSNVDIMAICAKFFAEQQAQMRDGILAHVDERLQHMEARLARRLDQHLREQMDDLKDDVEAQMSTTMDARVDEVTRDVDTLIDERIEDSILGIKIDLEKFVKDEIKNVEDTIKDEIEEGSFAIQFNR